MFKPGDIVYCILLTGEVRKFVLEGAPFLYDGEAHWWVPSNRLLQGVQTSYNTGYPEKYMVLEKVYNTDLYKALT